LDGYRTIYSLIHNSDGVADEARITINGTMLSADEARIVRLALESVANVLENRLGFADDGTALMG
jgi:hypothetical protein